METEERLGFGREVLLVLPNPRLLVVVGTIRCESRVEVERRVEKGITMRKGSPQRAVPKVMRSSDGRVVSVKL